MRSGWVFCGGMRRAGSTLQYQVASELLERNEMGRRMTYVPPENHSRVLADQPAEGLITFKTHELTPPVTNCCVERKAIALYIFRDIRDVVSSYQVKEKSRLDDAHLTALVLDLLEKDRQWRSLPRVYISRYEQVIFGLSKEVERIGHFLGTPDNGVLTKEVATLLAYENQKSIIESANEDDLVKVNPTNIYHRSTLLHRNHFNGGAIGRYRVDLTTQQISRVESLAGDWLSTYGYD